MKRFSFSLHALPPTLLAGGALTLLALLAALLSLVWLPWPIDAVDMNHKLLPPSAAHWLGTDAYGRDMAALLLAAFAPKWITPLLMIGGAYLCFEGVEKLLHKFLHRNEHEDRHDAEPEVTDEKTKVKGAVRTDFILSAEIIIIALGVVEKYDLMTRSLVMAAIGVGMTVLVYGLVGIIVKLDDLGMMLMRQKSAAVQGIGRGLISFMPWFMRGLSIVGTLAMFLVGGGLIAHNLGFLHDFLHAQHWDSGMMEHIANLVVGVAAGALACAIVLPAMKLFQKD